MSTSITTASDKMTSRLAKLSEDGLVLMTVPEVAVALALSKSQIYMMCRTGRLPSVRLGQGSGTSVRVALCDLTEYIARLRADAGAKAE